MARPSNRHAHAAPSTVRGVAYDLGLSGSASFAGKAYRIEVHGHTP